MLWTQGMIMSRRIMKNMNNIFSYGKDKNERTNPYVEV